MVEINLRGFTWSSCNRSDQDKTYTTCISRHRFSRYEKSCLYLNEGI